MGVGRGPLGELALIMGGVSAEFWSGKRVLLTGHTGFKGAWLSQMLVDFGARVTGFALPPDTSPNLFEALGLADRMDHRIGDIRDRTAFDRAIRGAEPEIVLHLAAQPIVSEGYVDPVGTFATNAMGTAHLLESLRLSGATIPVVVISSDKCYLNDGSGTAFTEEHLLGGSDPYSASKAATELVVNAYRAAYFSDGQGIALASGRAGNVVGGGDWCLNRLVPDMARAFAANATVVIRNPAATRPWQHVLEPLVGYLMCAEALAANRTFAQPWNFGPLPDQVYPVGAVVERMSAEWPAPTTISQPDVAQAWKEAKTLAIDPAKAMRLLGWKPIFGLDECIAWTAAWYHGYYAEPASALALTQGQIETYLDRHRRELAA